MPRGSVLDVVGWSKDSDRVSLAIVGDGMRLYKALGEGKPVLRSYQYTLDKRLASVLGLPQRDVEFFHGFDYDQKERTNKGTMHALFEGIEGAVTQWLDKNTNKPVWGYSASVTIIPRPGYPWYGKGSEFYSTTEKKWISPAEPPWRGEDVLYDDPDTGKQKLTPSANWCKIMGGISSAAGDAVADVGGRKIIVTHSFALDSRMPAEKAAKSLKGCGGFLFPSCAVGLIPGSGYGPCSLVLDASLVLRSLKPYRERGKALNFAVFSSDFWTETMTALSGRLAVELFQELTGATNAWSWTGGRPPLVTGPSRDEELTAVSGAKVLETVKGLATATRRRFSIWKRGMTLKQFNATTLKHSGANADNWAYLEAKGLGVIKPSAFVAAVVPQDRADKYAAFLQEVGLTCPIIPLARSIEERHAFSDYDSATEKSVLHSADFGTAPFLVYNYSWRVADAIRDAVKDGTLREGHYNA